LASQTAQAWSWVSIFAPDALSANPRDAARTGVKSAIDNLLGDIVSLDLQQTLAFGHQPHIDLRQRPACGPN
jgi:hypothetical protein